MANVLVVRFLLIELRNMNNHILVIERKNKMKKHYNFLVIIIALSLLLFASCKPGPGTGAGTGFNTLEEFKKNFSKFMAYPSYIPYNFDSIAEYKSYVAIYNEKGLAERKRFLYNIKKNRKRLDIFCSIQMTYSGNLYENEITESQIFTLSKVECAYLPNITLQEYLTKQKLELIKYESYQVYYSEYLYSDFLFPDQKHLNYVGLMNLRYYMSFDDKVYEFVILYYVKNGISEERFFELRDKLKEEALPEVIKSYESLKYENKD